MSSYYVYYRVDPAQLRSAGARINQLLTTVNESTGVAGRLMQKRGEANLWMEIYEDVANAPEFEAELERAVRQMKIMELLQIGSSRRIECFESLCDQPPAGAPGSP